MIGFGLVWFDLSYNNLGGLRNLVCKSKYKENKNKVFELTSMDKVFIGLHCDYIDWVI